MFDFIFLIVALAGLWVGSELVVRGAIRISARYNISEMVVGVILLSIGTDLPEIGIMLDAAIHSLKGVDKSGIILGSAVGSAIGQFGLAMGAAGLVGYLTLPRKEAIRYGTVLIGSAVILFVFGFDGTINRLEGGALTLFFVVFVFTLFFRQSPVAEELKSEREEPGIRYWGFLFLGLLLVLGNAELTVTAASGLAETMGISEGLVAAVIIGMGSSLPELSLSVMALLKKKGGLSIGNLFGSNVLDTLLVPGLGAVIIPLHMDSQILFFDLPFLIVLTGVVLMFLLFFRRGLQRREAVVLLGFYAVYVIIRFSSELVW